MFYWLPGFCGLCVLALAGKRGHVAVRDTSSTAPWLPLPSIYFCISYWCLLGECSIVKELFWAGQFLTKGSARTWPAMTMEHSPSKDP